MAISAKKLLTAVSLWLAYLLCNAAFSLISAFFPDEAEKNGASSFVVGVIISCSSLTVVILSPLCGYLLPLTGLFFQMIAGLLLVGGSYISLGFVTQLPSGWIFIIVCVLFRVTEGVGTAMFFTATFATYPKLFPESIGTVVALFEVAAGLGFLLGTPLGGVLYEYGGFKTPFITVGLTVVIATLPCTILVRKLSQASAIFISFSSMTFFSPILQPYLVNEFALSPLLVGMVYFSMSATYIVISLLAGPLSDKYGYRRYLIILGLLILVVGHLIMGPPYFISSHPNVWAVVASFSIIGIGGALGVVPVYSDLLATAESYISEEENLPAVGGFVSGVISSSISLGAFFGSLVGGAMIEFLTLPMSSVIFGEVVLADALLLIGVTNIQRVTVPRVPPPSYYSAVQT